jgi:arginase
MLVAGRFPLAYGGDSSVLLGAIPALRNAEGAAVLFFADGHEDATTMEQSLTGEVANMAVALLLGMTGARAPEPLRRHLPALLPEGLEMLGQRDAAYRRGIGVASIAGQVRLHKCGRGPSRSRRARIPGGSTPERTFPGLVAAH